MMNKKNKPSETSYQRYHIETKQAPNIINWPSRYKVQVEKFGLAKHLLTEMLLTKFDMEVVTSRPCLYGVYSGPIGGFAPREALCVGCLRCTTEFPEFVKILPNPERLQLGDSFFTSRYFDTVIYEAQGGKIPVKGAGYRGKFGGDGWDGMWTDMSEIVRPTRDGIHGREFISTVVDIGEKSSFLIFDEAKKIKDLKTKTFSLPVPFYFDQIYPAIASPNLYKIFAQAAEAVQTLQVIPIDIILEYNLRSKYIVPLVKNNQAERIKLLPYQPRMIEMDGWDEKLFSSLEENFPEVVIAVRAPFLPGSLLLELAEQGVSTFHLCADYHGNSSDGRFIFDLIREAHNSFVNAGRRDEITLIGSGGIVAAEHVPKAIIAGLDIVALDTPLLAALQGRIKGEFTGLNGASIEMPREIPPEWGIQRIMNLSAAWRDQLLEIMGAMGLREVRRLRGEMGRALFMVDLEREAFAGIEGYDG